MIDKIDKIVMIFADIKQEDVLAKFAEIAGAIEDHNYYPILEKHYDLGTYTIAVKRLEINGKN